MLVSGVCAIRDELHLTLFGGAIVQDILQIVSRALCSSGSVLLNCTAFNGDFIGEDYIMLNGGI
jgi:hypothetical protein